ncbi:MAG: hypothetical protein M1830_005057 [Pleopsidium flavum]|nr:MAG: hypothetical protein M1830_005057 [Pleopsidium flavum]
MSQLSIQLPPLPALQFGSDLVRSRLTEPDMYDSRSRSSRSLNFRRPVHREQLPPVSQLLTPSSQSSLSPTPFSPSYSIDSPASLGPVQQLSSRDWPSNRSRQPYPSSYPDADSTPPLPPPRRELTYPFPTSATVQLPAHSTAHAYSHHNKQEQVGSPYSLYGQRSHSDPSSYQHAQPAHQSQFDRSLPYRTSEQQYIPRAVREETIPGEGPCYVYEDGSHCRKVIDGETVNASWGVTKAGKPRKRLAIACMTCREKKIKCDPNWPKCLQCDKFGRECKFQNA